MISSRQPNSELNVIINQLMIDGLPFEIRTKLLPYVYLSPEHVQELVNRIRQDLEEQERQQAKIAQDQDNQMYQKEQAPQQSLLSTLIEMMKNLDKAIDKEEKEFDWLNQQLEELYTRDSLNPTTEQQYKREHDPQHRIISYNKKLYDKAVHLKSQYEDRIMMDVTLYNTRFDHAFSDVKEMLEYGAQNQESLSEKELKLMRQTAKDIPIGHQVAGIIAKNGGRIEFN